jgi:hypothetical protein
MRGGGAAPTWPAQYVIGIMSPNGALPSSGSPCVIVPVGVPMPTYEGG